ncbi:MAG: DUF1839 family protein [Gemmatimonadota bacterium]
MNRIQVLPGFEVAGYRRHELHADDRVWVEKNCYVDVCIELLHALGLEPLALLGACAAIDFEGDNFTFFKPSHDEMRLFFGLDVQELNVWRPLIEHAAEHLAAGKLISTETDSFNLPDTEGTDYQRNHVKTTIILADLDVEARRLGYFHNAGYYTLDGQDFARLFRLDQAPDPAFLPLFAEVIRVDRLVRRTPGALKRLARELLAIHVARRPASNPLVAFQHRFERDLPEIQGQGLGYYHAWAFATVRQVGAASELLSLHLRWLGSPEAGESLASAADDFERLSAAAKTFILKAARAVNTRRAVDASAIFLEMAQAWERGMSRLALAVGSEMSEQPV